MTLIPLLASGAQGGTTIVIPPTGGAGSPDVMDADFDSAALFALNGADGTTERNNVGALWGQAGSHNTFQTEHLSVIAEAGRGNVLRQQHVPNGNGTSPVGSYVDLDTAADTMWLQYDIYFETDFDTTTSGGKLPGLASSKSGLSGGTTATNEWSARFMHRSGGRLVVYSYDYYDDRSAFGGFGRDFALKNGDGSNHTLTKGAWTTIRQKIVVNTTATAFDGSVEVWVDGVKKLTRTGLRWWGPNSPGKISCQGFMYSAFYGGSSPSYNPDQTAHIRTDNYEIATSDSLLTGGTYA